MIREPDVVVARGYRYENLVGERLTVRKVQNGLVSFELHPFENTASLPINVFLDGIKKTGMKCVGRHPIYLTDLGAGNVDISDGEKTGDGD